CSMCYTALSKNEMPWLALNNHMYCGELPPDLQDITWVEEMACSLYCTTAHVARIFGSSSDSEPFQMCGNTCAHPMNLFKNATTLPWAPTSTMLSALYSLVPVNCGAKELSKLTPYVVRKPKIVALLTFLHAHNLLYAGLPPLDQCVLDMYPDWQCFARP
ncbi:hypothetical protein BT96DRAFT_833082, partial [Gymnopus androsaceus JB14]